MFHGCGDVIRPAGIAENGCSLVEFRQRSGARDHHRTTAGDRLQGRQAEAFIERRKNKAGGILIEGLQFRIAHVAQNANPLGQIQASPEDSVVTSAGNDDSDAFFAKAADGLGGALEVLVGILGAYGKNIPSGDSKAREDRGIGFEIAEVLASR
jgi:hypothetical protein